MEAAKRKFVGSLGNMEDPFQRIVMLSNGENGIFRIWAYLQNSS